MFEVFFLLFIVFTQSSISDGCICTEDGMSNGIQTGLVGCAFESPVSNKTICYVTVTDTCVSPITSNFIPDATFIECTMDEALLNAARNDDVTSIHRFRALNFLKITVSVDEPVFGTQEYSLLSYAAAYGSYRVVEDLLLYEDFDCDIGVPPDEALCLFTKPPQCEDDFLRQAILDLIDAVYLALCAPGEYLERVFPQASQPGIEALRSEMGTEFEEEVPSSDIRLKPEEVAPSSAVSMELDDEVTGSAVAEASVLAFESESAIESGVVPAICGQHPYFVSLSRSLSNLKKNGNNNHLCGGVLVDRNYVLTSASCAHENFRDHEKNENNVLIVSIASETRKGGSPGECKKQFNEMRGGVEILIHRGWLEGEFARKPGNDKDAALVRLNKETTKKPIKLSQMSPKIGEALRFVSLGKESRHNGFAYELKLQQYSVQRRAFCEATYRNGFGKDMICCGGRGLCGGQQGSPLFRQESGQDRLVGIAHYVGSIAECESGSSLYVNALELEDWIQDTIRKN